MKKQSISISIVLLALVLSIASSFVLFKQDLTQSQLVLSLFMGAVACFLMASINGFLNVSSVTFCSMLTMPVVVAVITAQLSKALTALILYAAYLFGGGLVVAVSVSLIGVTLALAGIYAVIRFAEYVEKLDRYLTCQEAEPLDKSKLFQGHSIEHR